MFKFLLLSIFVLFASAHISSVGNATTPTGQLLQGICDTLNITANDTEVDQCGDVPLIQDIEKLVDDLNHAIPNPFAIIADAKAIYGDYTQMKAECPEVAAAFGVYFTNLTAAWDNSPLKTVEHILDNIKNNAGQSGKDILAFGEDIVEQQYYQSGQEFGDLIEIFMIGYTN